MNLLPVIARLRDQVPWIPVEAPTRLNTIERERYPSATVLPGDEAPGESETLGTQLLQLVTCTVYVDIVAEAAREAADSDPLADAVAAVRAALLGYQADGWDLPLTLARGELVALDAGRLLWRDTYTTQRTLVASITLA